jgi:hypothetical protein
VNSAELERSKHRPVENLEAYDCYLRGQAYIRQFTRDGCTQALTFYRRAMALDPDFPTPYGVATHVYSTRKLQGWDFDEAEAVPEVRRLAERVSAVGQNDAVALSCIGFATIWVARDYDAGAAFADRALTVNANLGNVWIQVGAVRMFRGEHVEALQALERARRLSPIGWEHHVARGYAAHSLFLQGDYSQAMDAGSESALHLPTWLVGPLAAAACALSGDARSEAHLKHVLRIRPDLTLSRFEKMFTYRKPEDMKHVLDGLRRAGLTR